MSVEQFRRSWFMFLPPASIIVSLTLGYIYSDISFLCAQGTISVAGCMFIAAADKKVRAKTFLIIAILQIAAMLSAAVLPDSFADGWSPRMLIYCMGTALPPCYTLTINLFDCSRNPVFLAGYYPVRIFLVDVGRYIFALYNTSALLMLTSMSGAVTWLRWIFALSFLLTTVAVLAIMAVRYAATNGPLSVDMYKDQPTEQDVQLYQRLMAHMNNDCPYLDPECNTDSLCRDLGTNRGYISHCVNVCSRQSIPRMVNYYRVKHSMDLFTADMTLKVFELASLSGFGSVGTYSTAFRLETGMYPKEWCRQQKESALILGQLPSIEEEPGLEW